jgi:MFS family permease
MINVVRAQLKWMVGGETTRRVRNAVIALAGLASLFLSGFASLTAQTTIQRYLSTVFGGIDAVVMVVVSFSFIAGIGAGTLVGGRISRLRVRASFLWGLTEFTGAAALASYFFLFEIVNNFMMPRVLAASSEYVHTCYFAYIIAIQFLTSFLLATVMGMNYPLAFQAFSRSGTLSGGTLVICLLSVNTIGAALGSYLAPRTMVHGDLGQLMKSASLLYVIAGLLALVLAAGSSGKTMPQQQKEFPRPTTMSSRTAYLLLFIGGAVGLSFEIVVFRHFLLRDPLAHSVFGKALGVYLVCWSIGTVLASCRWVSLRTVSLLFAFSLFISCAMLCDATLFKHLILQKAPIESYLVVGIFFLPALFSGWFFSCVHQEAGNLDVGRISKMYLPISRVRSWAASSPNICLQPSRSSSIRWPSGRSSFA